MPAKNQDKLPRDFLKRVRQYQQEVIGIDTKLKRGS